MTRRPWTVASVLATTAALAAWGTAPASAGTAAKPKPHRMADARSVQSASRTPGKPVPATQTVRLITGDIVRVTRTTKGGKTTAATTVIPAKRAGGARVTFASWGDTKHLYVIPSDVARLVGHQLDRRLFDVTGYAATGLYEKPTLPVIVQFGGAAAKTTSALRSSSAAMAGKAKVRVNRTLGTVDAVSTSVSGTKGRGLLDQLPTSRGANKVGVNNVSRIFLDAPVAAADTTSMPQIGAPAAWAAGYTGTGVKVAVLDTGIDATHPDLVGQVVAAQNFSTSADTGDHFGHGTHVASIIAGTGAAEPAGQDLRGVAYGAKLLNGKVLGDDGFGDDSGIIAAMEWAAQNGASVINLSLGSGQPSDGLDPMSQAVNTLSDQYGVLVVAAAGNEGQFGTRNVSTPAAADRALAVGAVDASDTLADFSNTGPRAGDSALKPDIVAPGVDILAARAADAVFGTPGEQYVALSGTSMATPHVAGAAALLHQARPDLTGQELKSALMGGSKGLTGTVWQDGAGRLDIPGALDTPVVAEPASLSFGMVTYPAASATPQTKALVYRNPSNADVTLDLSPDVTDASGATVAGVTLSATHVVVPAGGKASVDVTVDPRALPVGLYGGIITATPSTGHAVRTSIGWENEPKKVNVTIDPRSHTGGPAVFLGSAIPLNDESLPTVDLAQDGPVTVRLQPGLYTFVGFADASTPQALDMTLAVADEVSVTTDRRVTLGGRQGRSASVHTPRRATFSSSQNSYVRATASGDRIFSYWLMGVSPAGQYVTPTRRARVGTAAYAEIFGLDGPGATPRYDYQLAYPTQGYIPRSGRHLVSQDRLAAVTVRYRAMVADTLGLAGWTFADSTFGAWGVLTGRTMPSTRTSYVTAKLPWAISAAAPDFTDRWPGTWYEDAPRTYARGQRASTEFFTQVASPTAVFGGGGIRQGDEVLSAMPINSDSQGRASWDLGPETTSTLTVSDGATVLASNDVTPEVRFTAPSHPTTLRFEQNTARTADWWPLSTRMTSVWTVPTQPTDPTASPAWLPFLDVQYAVRGLDSLNRVGAGPVSVGLTVLRATDSGPQVITPASLSLEWSSDDGTTWHPATVSTTGGATTGTFTIPSGSGPVSLRAAASDDAGSSVTETVTRAVGVR